MPFISHFSSKIQKYGSLNNNLQRKWSYYSNEHHKMKQIQILDRDIIFPNINSPPFLPKKE